MPDNTTERLGYLTRAIEDHSRAIEDQCERIDGVDHKLDSLLLAVNVRNATEDAERKTERRFIALFAAGVASAASFILGVIKAKLLGG